MGRRRELPIAERAREPEHLSAPQSVPVTRITSSSSSLPTRNAGCVALPRFCRWDIQSIFIAGMSTSGDSIFPPWPEFLRPAERPSRISAADSDFASFCSRKTRIRRPFSFFYRPSGYVR